MDLVKGGSREGLLDSASNELEPNSHVAVTRTDFDVMSGLNKFDILSSVLTSKPLKSLGTSENFRSFSLLSGYCRLVMDLSDITGLL